MEEWIRSEAATLKSHKMHIIMYNTEIVHIIHYTICRQIFNMSFPNETLTTLQQLIRLVEIIQSREPNACSSRAFTCCSSCPAFYNYDSNIINTHEVSSMSAQQATVPLPIIISYVVYRYE